MAQKRQPYDFLLLGRRIKNKNVWGKREKKNSHRERERRIAIFILFGGIITYYTSPPPLMDI